MVFMHHNLFNHFPLGDISQVVVLKNLMSPLCTFMSSSAEIITKSRFSESKNSYCVENFSLSQLID